MTMSASEAQQVIQANGGFTRVAQLLEMPRSTLHGYAHKDSVPEHVESQLRALQKEAPEPDADVWRLRADLEAAETAIHRHLALSDAASDWGRLEHERKFRETFKDEKERKGALALIQPEL